MRHEIIKKYIYIFGTIVLVALFLELTLFNYKHYITMGNAPETAPQYQISAGLISEGNNKYRIKRENSAYIEILNLNKNINSLQLDVVQIEENLTNRNILDSSPYMKLKVSIWGTDDANQLYFDMGDRNIVKDVPESEYMVLHLSGESEKLKVQFHAEQDVLIEIKGIVLNPVIPMNYSLLRFALMILIPMMVYVLRPKSELYNIKYDKNCIWQKVVNPIIFIMFIIMAFKLVCSNPIFVENPFENHYQYQDLARALADGKVYIDKVPDSELVQMENPYDSSLRDSEGVKSLWDRAYFEGKYYVYFGVVPVIVYYLPGLLLTGHDAPTYIGVFLTAILFFAGLLALINAIIRRWFSKISYLIYLYMVGIFTLGCGILSILIRPDFYNLPILMGITFSLWGLFFLITAVNKTEDGEKVLVKSRLLAGSLCMALVAGCRPQLLVMSFIAVPLFWNEVVRDKILIVGRKLGNTFSFIMPYVIIASGIMYYNFIRFGSVFDFGANYNLTTNDMTHRGIELGRTGVGIFSYLFEFPNLKAVFPFLNTESVYTTYLGRTISENMLGGLIACNILLIITFFVFRFRKILRERNVYGITWFSIVMSFVLVVVDTQMAGILPRYIYDFAWMLFIAASLMVFALETYICERKDAVLTYIWRGFLVASLLWSVGYNFLRLFIDTAQQIELYNPELFYRAAHGIAFWM